MELIFFKSDTTRPVRVRTTPDGKIDFRVLGRSMGLEPGSITLCDEWFTETDLRSDATWTQIKNVLRVAGTSEDPVVVSGRPILEVPTGMFDLIWFLQSDPSFSFLAYYFCSMRSAMTQTLNLFSWLFD